ncbi:hypothetical protein [Mucilaginibacter sp. SG564]|uniref:hypothetical protein n=1 Tax=Mucilaginibacter sp. SG564 TaxID=2587022 RepID=UPI00155588B9|nr:hypothetical protein [Mucilaginibacter sp. SG564]
MKKTTYFELKDIIFNERLLTSFVKSKFIPIKNTKRALLENNHPLGSYNFNRVIRSAFTSYSLMSIPVTGLYAYLKDDNQVCLYLLIQLTGYKQVDTLIDQIGWPWNITKEDYELRDFESLLWQKQQLEITLSKNFNYENPQSGNLIRIANMPLIELINSDSWE